MANQKLATVTNELIESYGNTAKNVINAYRVGNERAVVFMDQSFEAALDKAVATRGRFQLIEVMIQRGVLSSTLQRFVAGVKRLSAGR